MARHKVEETNVTKKSLNKFYHFKRKFPKADYGSFIETPLTRTNRLQSTVRKKMAALHFTTKPWERNTDSSHIKSHILRKIAPVLATLCMLSLKFLQLCFTFL